jgi:hypothetical protein
VQQILRDKDAKEQGSHDIDSSVDEVEEEYQDEEEDEEEPGPPSELSLRFVRGLGSRG